MSITMQSKLGSDTWGTMASSLAKKLTALGQPATSALIERALRDLLDGQDQSTRQLRMSIQIHLAILANAGTADVGSEEMLSTEAAAKLMGCSRPYVAMLIDAERLAGGVKSRGGHRKVPKSSVLQWIEATRAAGMAGNPDYRKSAADLEMYATPETEYVKAARRGR